MARAQIQKKIYTIGHGNKPFDELVDMLKTYHIRTLVDIRSYPGSRRNPHFNREVLESKLPQARIAYEWFKGLGGYRKDGLGAASPHVILKSRGFRNYADYMLTKAFKENTDKLLRLASTCPPSLSLRHASRNLPAPALQRQAGSAEANGRRRGGRGGNTCIMCAETLPFRCHRWLISDYLVANQVEVVHIIDAEKTAHHRLSGYARIHGGNVFYDSEGRAGIQ